MAMFTHAERDARALSVATERESVKFICVTTSWHRTLSLRKICLQWQWGAAVGADGSFPKRYGRCDTLEEFSHQEMCLY